MFLNAASYSTLILAFTGLFRNFYSQAFSYSQVICVVYICNFSLLISQDNSGGKVWVNVKGSSCGKGGQ